MLTTFSCWKNHKKNHRVRNSYVGLLFDGPLQFNACRPQVQRCLSMATPATHGIAVGVICGSSVSLGIGMLGA